MIERDYRATRPFGHRRSEESSHGRNLDFGRDGRSDTEVRDWEVAPKAAGPLAWALRTAALAGLAAIFATQYLARVSQPNEVAITRIAQGGRVSPADPETTGSISRVTAAQATRLDPCAVAARPRP